MNKHQIELEIKFHTYEQDKWARRLLEANLADDKTPNKAEYQAVCRRNYNDAADRVAACQAKLDALEE